MSISPLVLCHPPPAAWVRRPPPMDAAEDTKRIEIPIRSLMLISDGHVRYGGYEEGYDQGYRTILSFVEACAGGRSGIDALFTPLCSAKNLARRAGEYWEHLYRQLLRLNAEHRRGRVLQNVRVRSYGDLERMKSMGGFAEEAAHQIEAICDSTTSTPAPRFTWGLLAGYSPDALVDLGIDGVVRTAMEEPGTIRLSGLDPHLGAALVGVTELGPKMTSAQLEEAISRLRKCAPVVYETGYTAHFTQEMLSSLASGAPRDPFTLVLPVQGSPAEVGELVRIHGSAAARHGITVEHWTDFAEPALAGETRGQEQRRVLLVSPATFGAIAAHREAEAWLLPTSDESGACRLLRVRLGDANVHLCGSAPGALLGGLCRAIEFRHAHPALHGGERCTVHEARAARRRAEAEHLKVVARAILREPHGSVEQIAKRWAGPPVEERLLHWDLAAVRELLRARASGLLPAGAKWEKAALGYAYTTVVSAYRAPGGSDATGEAWESVVRILAPVLMSVACTDEDCFERWPSETAEAQWERCCTSAAYLSKRTLGDRYLPVPDVAGWEKLQMVAAFWDRLFAEHEPVAHPRVLRGFSRAIAELYEANLRELDTPSRRRDVEQALRGLVPPRMGGRKPIPAAVSSRMQALSDVRAGDPGWQSTRLELAALVDLRSTRPSIAAGVVCLALAMLVPAPMMTADTMDLVERVADLMDWTFRISNDLASITDSAHGDRDSKENTWTVLVPAGTVGREREEAKARAVAVCLDILERLDGELDREITALIAAAPRLGTLVSRAVDFGRQAYAGRHYSKLSLSDLHRMAMSTVDRRKL